MELVLIEAEKFHNIAKALPVPVIAFGIYFEDNPVVLLVYEDLERAA